MSPLLKYPTRSWEWFVERSHGTHAKAWLFALSFSESSFFIIPPEVLMIAILMADSSRWVWYALYTSAASIVGAMFGYAVAYFFFEAVGQQIIDFYGLTEHFAHVGSLYENNAFWVTFTAAFTPIPYKVFVLAAGFFKVDFIAFILASILGRTLRYGIVAYIVHLFGARAARMALRYANTATIILVGIVFVAAVIWYFFIH